MVAQDGILANDSMSLTEKKIRGHTHPNHKIRKRKAAERPDLKPSKHAAFKKKKKSQKKKSEAVVKDHNNQLNSARIRLEELTSQLDALSNHENNPEYNLKRQEVHKAAVDYNYAWHYPVAAQWRPPPTTTPTNAYFSSLKKSNPIWNNGLWLLVEQSMANGTLDQVRDGTLVTVEIPQKACRSVGIPWRGSKSRVNGGRQELERSVSWDQSGDVSSRNFEQMTINVDDEPKDKEPGDEDEDYDPDSGSEEGEVAEDAMQSEEAHTTGDHSGPAGLLQESIEIQQSDGPTGSRTRRSTLNDLTPELLHKQLMYFYIGKLPDEVDRNLPVKCLACGGVSHDSDDCAALKCGNCGAYNKHLTIRCPTRLKCSKCRELGNHTESSCPYKLKQLSLDEIICDLCQTRGHDESDCELVWRTSTKTLGWEQVTRQYAPLSLSCYECGDRTHLGNDCPTRKPRKGLGSSTWSLYRKFDAPLNPDGIGPFNLPPRPDIRHATKLGKAVGMQIKGLAKAEAPLQDRDDFLHPRKQPLPLPQVRPGQQIMHINPGVGRGLSQNPDSVAPLMSMHQPLGSHGGVTKPNENLNSAGYQHAHTTANSAKEAAFIQYNHGNPSYDDSYERRRGRSRSPLRSYSNSEYRNDRYQPGPPPLPPPLRDRRGGDVYRPMPSAARDAFRRHRV